MEYDYEAEFCDELTIRQGEVITNVKQMSGGWWEGTHPSGKHGLFPENFVKVVAGVTTTESSSDVELRKGKRCRVLFSYRPSHEDELELKPNEARLYFWTLWLSRCRVDPNFGMVTDIHREGLCVSASSLTFFYIWVGFGKCLEGRRDPPKAPLGEKFLF